LDTGTRHMTMERTTFPVIRYGWHVNWVRLTVLESCTVGPSVNVTILRARFDWPIRIGIDAVF